MGDRGACRGSSARPCRVSEGAKPSRSPLGIGLGAVADGWKEAHLTRPPIEEPTNIEVRPRRSRQLCRDGVPMKDGVPKFDGAFHMPSMPIPLALTARRKTPPDQRHDAPAGEIHCCCLSC